MAAYLDDWVLDNGVAALVADTTHLYICSAAPTTYTEATSTYALGSKTGPTVTGPSNGSVNGRRAIVSAITDGVVASAGTASHFALVDSVNSRLLAAQALSATLAVDVGTFTLTSISITIPDAV
jgi:hypothetical protein